MSHSVHDITPTTSLDSVNLEHEECFQRRLRHISSIQVRNLTPFPVRDAFASALARPAEHSQFTPLGNFSDDLDITLSRKRSRRISTNSVNTLQSARVDDHAPILDNGDGRGRRRTHSKVSFSGGGSAEPTQRSNAISRTISTYNRARTNSMVSSMSVSTANINVHSSTSNTQAPSTLSTVLSSSLFFDYSQRTLEKVIESRLVETFISITVPDTPDVFPLPSPLPTTQRTRAESAPRTRSFTFNDFVVPNSVASVRKASKTSRPNSAESSKAAPLSRPEPSSSIRSSTTLRKGTPPVRTAGASLMTRVVPKTHKSSTSVPRNSTASQLPSPPASPASPEPPLLRTVPNYISPIHQPSTNPSFVIDARSEFEFAPWTDLGADTVKIELWAKTCRHLTSGAGASLESKGKQKEMLVTDPTREGPEWTVLEQWNVTLADLVPLKPELEAHPSRLPSNTLFISFSTHAETFYLPTRSVSGVHSHSRSPSPTAQEFGSFGHSADPTTPARFHLPQTPSEQPNKSRRSRKTNARTASSQDLLQLVTLQSCIIDHEESLADVIRQIDTTLDNDVVAILNREASEREACIEDRQSEAKEILERACLLRGDIASRRKRLKHRRDILATAGSMYAEDQANLRQTAVEVAEQKRCLDVLWARLAVIRTSLISTLSWLYPIELFSSSELLFTILAVPLPIPFNTTEPAPPLSLASHKEVTEDAVATALGFAAQLVQLLAIYMGKGLTYPITCIGSRSLIRDDISAMVGPRMFPLFSKGVDTYRFEYGVFLLNKDIEMLMADRDLRALDMRHTLPNLKNLLLTLTDGECASVHNSRVFDSPASSGLVTPLRAHSLPPTLVLTPDSPKANHCSSELPADVEAESTTPTESGSTTPTATTPFTEASTFSRYSKLSIGFPPLPGFLRSRNGSAVGRVSVKLDPETGWEAEDGVQGATSGLPAPNLRIGEDEDRRTIRGVVVDCEEGKPGELNVSEGAKEPMEKTMEGASAVVNGPCTVVSRAS
ncbi:uncharacterized protein F5147DRAFT_691713 [Suillus discolor]|uniref:UV radiation resistance-associated gene protein n=1 Tax=Suillus discolor TaxID=1912936 RepID=A0A9P7JUU2_9AGAM|nr:uncharacterized protein F5147DRAFT_691713 [Suillus discolor]KAG2109660.1 hypothetical protein F5147DRAFT_691713 [Suillus discolor]